MIYIFSLKTVFKYACLLGSIGGFILVFTLPVYDYINPRWSEATDYIQREHPNSIRMLFSQSKGSYIDPTTNLEIDYRRADYLIFPKNVVVRVLQKGSEVAQFKEYGNATIKILKLVVWLLILLAIGLFLKPGKELKP